jgi:hypothetical protein
VFGSFQRSYLAYMGSGETSKPKNQRSYLAYMGSGETSKPKNQRSYLNADFWVWKFLQDPCKLNKNTDFCVWKFLQDPCMLNKNTDFWVWKFPQAQKSVFLFSLHGSWRIFQTQ